MQTKDLEVSVQLSASSKILSLTIFIMEKPMVDITATIKIYSTEV
jgi:hypothetical protein